MTRLKLCICLTFFFFLGGMKSTKAQNIAIKSNLLYDLTATANLGVEIGLAPKWTLDVSGNLNAWSKNDHTKWKHWMVQPEARYWFCDRFSRHFIGAHLLGGAFNFGNINNNISFLGTDFSALSGKRYQGYAYGAGVAYGFAFVLSKHLNLELEAGVGYLCLDYETFECDGCGRKVADGFHHYVGPTKAAVNLVFVF
jgi:hypothetical protein